MSITVSTAITLSTSPVTIRYGLSTPSGKITNCNWDDMFHEAYKIAYSELKNEFNIKENNPEVVKLSELFNDVYPSEILEPILNIIWAIDAIGTKMYDAKEQYKKDLYTVN